MTCQVVSSLAAKQDKLAAISETGVRVMKKVDSTIYFDGIQAVTLEEDQLKNVDVNGLIITDASLVKKDEPTTEEASTEETTTEGNGTASTASGQKTTESGKNTPKTGDSMPVYPAAGILLLSLLVAGSSLAGRRNR